jgi:hypothetical protein
MDHGNGGTRGSCGENGKQREGSGSARTWGGAKPEVLAGSDGDVGRAGSGALGTRTTGGGGGTLSAAAAWSSSVARGEGAGGASWQRVAENEEVQGWMI